LAAAVLPRLKNKLTQMVMVPSDGGRFEISLGGELIYSKLATGKFPDHETIIRQIEAKTR
jgi:selenoprotein W-related protein